MQPDGSVLINDPHAQVLTPDALERMEVRYQSVNGASPSQISAGKSQARYIVEMGGRKYAIATPKRDQPDYAYMLYDHPMTGDSGNPETHFQYLLLKEIEQSNADLRAFKALLVPERGVRDSSRSSYESFYNLRPTWEKNLKITRAKLAKAVAAAVENHVIGEGHIFELGINSDLIRQLIWWGFEQDFDYWKRHERLAVSNERPKAWFFSSGPPSDFATNHRIAGIPEGLIAHQKEPTNSARPTEEMKKPLFTYSKRSGAESDVKFFALMDPGLQGEHTAPVTLGATDSWSISLDTQVPIPSAQGTVVIPTPNLYELTDLEVRSPDGTLLTQGTDYKIFKTTKQKGYFIHLTDSTRTHVGFVAKFKSDGLTHLKPSQLGKIDPHKLFPLVLELKKGGFSVLAAGLEERAALAENEGTQLTIEEIAHVFKNTAYYSYVSEQPHSSSQGRFAKYARFLDDSGRLCAQCDGSNVLYSDFMAAYFEDTHQVSVGVQTGFSTEGNELQLATLHAQTEFKINGSQVYITDVTPHIQDPRNETKPPTPPIHEARTSLPRAKIYADKLREKRGKLVKAFEKVGAIDPSEPFAKAVRTSSVIDDFINGKITFAETQAKLQVIFPGQDHSYSTIEELLNLVSKAAAHEKALLLQHQRRSLRREIPPSHYARYSEPKRNNALIDSLEYLGDIDKILNPEELRKNWRTTPRSCSLEDTLRGLLPVR